MPYVKNVVTDSTLYRVAFDTSHTGKNKCFFFKIQIFVPYIKNVITDSTLYRVGFGTSDIWKNKCFLFKNPNFLPYVKNVVTDSTLYSRYTLPFEWNHGAATYPHTELKILCFMPSEKGLLSVQTIYKVQFPI